MSKYEVVANPSSVNDTNISVDISEGYNSTAAAPQSPTSNTNWAMMSLSALILFTFFGNLLVLLAVIRQKSLQSLSNYVIASLAAADLLLATFVEPFGLFVLVKGEWGLGIGLCIVYMCLDVTFCTASILHLCAIGVNRFLAVSYPLKYSRERYSSRKRILSIIIPVWVVSIVISVPLMVTGIIDENKVLTNDGKQCGLFDNNFIIYSSIASFFAPLTIMTVVHVRSVQVLRQKRSGLKIGKGLPKPCTNETMVPMLPRYSSSSTGSTSATNGSAELKPQTRAVFVPNLWRNKPRRGKYGGVTTEIMSNNDNHILRKREDKATKTLVIVFACFFVLWLPFFCVNMTIGLCSDSKRCPHISFAVFQICTWLGYLSSAINPVVYAFCNSDFRMAFYNIIMCKNSSPRITSTKSGSPINLKKMLTMTTLKTTTIRS